ncbi:unnamed protein product, partial [Onchocerca ochengi]
PLFERSTAFRHSTNIPHFGEFCDSLEQLHAFAPLTKCTSTCISIMEPQYFGGELKKEERKNFLKEIIFEGK